MKKFFLLLLYLFFIPMILVLGVGFAYGWLCNFFR